MKCEMMVDIDQIWADVDALRGCEPTRESEEGHTRNSAFLKAAVCASCGGAKVVTCEGMPVCQECGLVENMYMHEGAEWISSYGEDGVITDNSRCPLSERNPELFSAQWGTRRLSRRIARRRCRSSEWQRSISTNPCVTRTGLYTTRIQTSTRRVATSRRTFVRAPSTYT